MAVRGDIQSDPRALVNWGAGIKGMGAAWILLSTGLWYDSVLPLVAAGLVGAFTLFGPLRIGYFLLSREFGALLLRASILILVVTAVAYPASLAANSAQPTVAAFGNVLFIGLLTTVGAMFLGAARTAALRSFPLVRVAATSVVAIGQAWVVQVRAAIRGA